jgi:hypothetical protein
MRRGAAQMQERAVKRYKNLRLLSRDQDKEALRNNAPNLNCLQVQERAVKRHKNLRLLSRDQDKEALRNTAPILNCLQVQERAVKRYKNLRLLSRDQDKEALRNAPLIIAAKASAHTSLCLGCALVSVRVRIRILHFTSRVYADPKLVFTSHTGSEIFLPFLQLRFLAYYLFRVNTVSSKT